MEFSGIVNLSYLSTGHSTTGVTCASFHSLRTLPVRMRLFTIVVIIIIRFLVTLKTKTPVWPAYLHFSVYISFTNHAQFHLLIVTHLNGGEKRCNLQSNFTKLLRRVKSPTRQGGRPCLPQRLPVPCRARYMG